MMRALCLLAMVGCAQQGGVGAAPQAIGCRWNDVDITADHPDAQAIAGLPAGTIVGAAHVHHIDAWTLSLTASTSVDFGADVYRFLYVSIIDGEPQLVSARFAVPDRSGPPGPVALVAHQHGTFGFGDGCAPSSLPGFGFESELNPNAAWALTQNFAVVMTDYPGLGTPGPHPYVARRPTGTSVLDAILAAQTFCDDQRDVAPLGLLPTLLEGHSQGAHATVAALTLLDSRNEPFDIRGAVAISLPAQHEQLIARMTTGDVEPALAVMGIAGQIHARPSQFGNYEDWFVPDIVNWWTERADEACAPEMSARFARPAAEMLRADVLTAISGGDFDSLGVVEALADESLVPISAQVPLLVLHGAGDALIPVDIIEELASQWPSDVATLEVMAGEDHWVLPSIARQRVFAFLSDQLAN
jgi:pimeloyl-ACP methyl ester carboxylesterase